MLIAQQHEAANAPRSVKPHKNPHTLSKQRAVQSSGNHLSNMFGSGFGQQSSNNTSSFGFGQPQQPQTTSLFGQPAQPLNATATPFGSSTQSTPFGSLGGGSAFGSNLGTQQAQPQGQGTVIPFSAHEENDPAKAGKIDRYETITMMPQYANTSLQELRWQDYEANRKGPTSSGFGFGQAQGNTSGGGLFGQQPAQQSFGSSPFGNASAPGAGTGGLFGQSSAPSTQSSGLFGSNQAGSSAFGAPATSSGLFNQGSSMNTSNTFGSGSSTFGSNAAPSGFGFGSGTSANGSSSGVFGQSGGSGSSFGFGGGANTSQSRFGSTGATGGGLFGQSNNQTGGAFGQSSGFGGFGSNNNTSTSGGGLFGQKPNQPGGSGLFGQQNNTSIGFGQSNTGSSLFGQNNTTAGTSLFGQNGAANNNPAQGNAGTSGFGQPQQQQQPGQFGFNQAQGSAPASGGLFGQSGNTGTSFGQSNSGFGSTGGLFGKPASTGAFGSATNQQSGFGANASQPGTLGSSGGLFGQQQQQQQQQQPKPAFGFGQSSTTQPTSTFGSLALKPEGNAFGQATNQGSSTGTGIGLFGSNNNNNNAANTSNNNLNTTQGSTGGLFGSNNSGGSGFGSTGGGLFGSNSTNNATGGTTNSTSLFGSKPANGQTGLFGGATNTSNTTTGSGLFGGSSLGGSAAGNTGGLNNNSGGLLGASKLGTSGGFLGSNSNTTAAPLGSSSGGLFGSALNTQQPQAQAAAPTAQIASVDSNAYLSNPLFNNVKPLSNGSSQSGEPAAVPGNKSSSFKAPSGTLLAQIMQPRPLPRGNRFSVKVAVKSGKEHALAAKDGFLELGPYTANSRRDQKDSYEDKFRNVLFSSATDDIILNTEAFDFARNGLKAPALPAAPASASNVSVSTPGKTGKRSSHEEPENSTKLSLINEDDDSEYDATSSAEQPEDRPLFEADPAGADIPDNELVDPNGYWISPSKHKLANMTLRELRRVVDFRVGQRTQGFVEFLEPVDLSMFSDVQAQICGHIVLFGDRSFCLYPVESERPVVGQGFNVKHRVTLYNVFARSRDTAEPIKDPDHPIARKFQKRLQTQGKFVSWSAQTGTWTFEVDPRSQ